jgi:DNA polymerase-3 subunit alpha
VSERLKQEMKQSGGGDANTRAALSGKEDDGKAAPVSTRKFVHLHTHSAYSLLEGALPLATLIKLAIADNQPALAITDTGNLFGALEFSEKTVGDGLQPIIGCSLEIDFGDNEDNATTRGGSSKEAMSGFPTIVLLAQNQKGTEHLIKLVSQAYLNNEDGSRAHLSLDGLRKYREGLILLTGGPSGPLDQLLAEGRDE